MEKFLKIQELSRLAGVNSDTVRYYEKIGLLPKPQRAANGYRLYDGNNLKSLEFIKTCRSLGFTIDEIKQLQQLKSNPMQNCRNADELAERHLHEVTSKIAQLTEIQHFLQGLVGCGKHQVEQCQVLNSLQQLAQNSKK